MAQGLILHRIGRDLLAPFRRLQAVFLGVGRPAPAELAPTTRDCGIPADLDRFQRMLIDLSSQAHLRRTVACPSTSLRATLRTVGTALVVDPTTSVDDVPIERAHLDAILADLTPLHGLATVRAHRSARGVLLTVRGLRDAQDADRQDLSRVGRIVALYDGHVVDRMGLPGEESEIEITLPQSGS